MIFNNGFNNNCSRNLQTLKLTSVNIQLARRSPQMPTRIQNRSPTAVYGNMTGFPLTHKKLKNIFYGQNVEILKVKHAGTFSNNWNLKG